MIECSNCNEKFEPKKPYWKMCPYCARESFSSAKSAYDNIASEEAEYYGIWEDDWIDPLN